MLERNQRPLITRQQTFFRLIVMGRGIAIGRYRNFLALAGMTVRCGRVILQR